MAPLDTARPLWEFTLVGGVERGRAALITSSATPSPTGSVAWSCSRCCSTPSARRPPRPPVPEPIPIDLTPSEITQQALRRLPGNLIGVAGSTAAGVLGTGARLWSRPRQSVMRTSEYVSSLRRVLGKTAPPSPLLVRRSNSRRVLLHGSPASTTSSERRNRLAAPSTTLAACPVAVPVNRRTDGTDAGGNQWNAVSSPGGTVDSDGPAMRTIGQSLRTARSEQHSTHSEPPPPILEPAMPTSIVHGTLGEAVPRADVRPATSLAGRSTVVRERSVSDQRSSVRRSLTASDGVDRLPRLTTTHRHREPEILGCLDDSRPRSWRELPGPP